ncbi:hypothetical protein Cgig2_034014 [Carnegiea gigantea]|uniref:Uncharacterized protein n=1 Tax=Carnegiea gigantea TaxID=171969 RepID=A0A9Q1JH42_9CARY|nr:hypothetical protein Cgig2_034014 [Carnegiea gigantea]
MHEMRKVDEKTGAVVGGEKLDDDYNTCILPSNNDRHPGGPPSKRRESQTQDKKVCREFEASSVTRNTAIHVTALASVKHERALPYVCKYWCSPNGGSHPGLMLLMADMDVAVGEGLLKRLGCIFCMVSAKDYTVSLTPTELYIRCVKPISGNPTGMGKPTLLVYDLLSHCSYHMNGTDMAGPSRRRTFSQPSTDSGTTLNYYNSGHKFYCFYRLEAAVLETNDNYRWHFVAYPRKSENACPFLNVIGPDYPKQVRDVIDELAVELREVPDMIRVEQNDHHLMQDENRATDMKIRLELGK